LSYYFIDQILFCGLIKSGLVYDQIPVCGFGQKGICIVVFIKSTPSNYKVVLTTSRRSRLNQVKRHNPSTISHLYLYVRLVSHLYTLTHSFSEHISKVVAVAGGRRREAHAQSWFAFCVLVLVLALYWQSIIEEVFAGFSPP
jgi:hypothetical protein